MTIKFSITKSNGKSFEYNDEYYVDTGFNGDLKLPQSMGSRLKGMGIKGVVELVTDASGDTTNDIFQAMISEIILNNTNILNNPQSCIISCFGKDKTAKLVGLNALRNWKVCVDLPQQILSIE